MTLDDALQGSKAPLAIRSSLVLLELSFVDFNGVEKKGQLVVHTEIAEDVRNIFAELFKRRFPIAKMQPIVAYNWDDDASMTDNNSSAFNYRIIYGTDQLSNHSFGRAIDINPAQNPYTRRDGTNMPKGAVYDVRKRGTVTLGIVALFKSYGFSWGGDWEKRKDWQHFEKL